MKICDCGGEKSMACASCKYCRFPRSANDNNGKCKCKIMKNKTIEVYVSGGETPTWCPKKGKDTISKPTLAIVARKCEKCENPYSSRRNDLENKPFLCNKCYELEIQKFDG